MVGGLWNEAKGYHTCLSRLNSSQPLCSLSALLPSHLGVPKRIVAAAITAVAGSGVDGDWARGVRESAGAKAIPISMARGAVGCVFELGTMATG